ncbi:MAG: Bax inhibitor-1/YccA family protein [Endomicrobium sp.]|jgi:uncharacterized YccA/Bax inhibitor family protein|nr:Bax inhibitor-1/YccA family protein [Endomicrobium sp.]
MSNPLLKDSVFKVSVGSNEFMSVSGVINKSIILWCLLLTGAFYSWIHSNIIMPLINPIAIVAFALALIMVFKKTASPILAPVYAVCEGLVLGTISLLFEKLYPGIIVNAVLLTICVLFCMLAAYKTGLLKATPRFQKIIILSMFAIALVYIIDFVLNLFGSGHFSYIHNSSGFGIVISFAIVVIAALNLIIDFDLIEQNVNYNAPKYMEWYSAFSLMVTLVWLYMEVVRFLSKLKKD